MFSDLRILGYRAHLVLEDGDGAFEIKRPFKLQQNSESQIVLDLAHIQAAIDERLAAKSPPLQREVKFHAE